MMKLHNMLPFRSRSIGLALLSLSAAASAADSLSQTYCSTQNTGSDFSPVNNIYQSNGACYTACNAQQYAFAIVQWQNCWCSNYIPASQDDTSNCSENCPGYPAEQCGNQDGGYYGYVALPRAASGTAGASSASSTPQPSSTEQSTTEEPSTTEDPATSYTPTTRSTSSPKPSTTSTSSTSESTSEPPATPVTSVIMTTISGAIVTQTVTTTPVVAPGSHSDQIPLEEQHSGLGSGAIAGIVIGALAGVALLFAAAFFLWRRNRMGAVDAENSTSGGSKKSMKRNVSVLSKAGLLARNRPSMGERDHDDSFYVTPPTGQNSVRHSMLFAGVEGVSPVSPLDSSHSNDSGKSARVYDQRLNPSALFANHENGSRISMQDQQDYSRPLGVTNPDPRASFDSRFSRG